MTNAKGCTHAALGVCMSLAPCCGCCFPGDKLALSEWLCVTSCWDNDLLGCSPLPQSDGAACSSLLPWHGLKGSHILPMGARTNQPSRGCWMQTHVPVLELGTTQHHFPSTWGSAQPNKAEKAAREVPRVSPIEKQPKTRAWDA